MRYYKVQYAGCNHSSILSESQLKSDVKGKRISSNNLAATQDLFMCPACLNGEPGCNVISGNDDRTVLRTLAAVRKLSPLEIFQLGIVEKARA